MEIWIWLFIIIILCAFEANTISLVSIWFIISGIISLILSILGIDFSICFAVFVVVGVILMVTTRKTLIKLLKVKKENTNLDRIIGKKGVVTEEIKKDSIGEVKVDGKKWSAYSNEFLPEGTIVRILEINSVKLNVEKRKE